METWQRARSEDQVEQRINQILESAALLFRTHNYQDVTITKIANQAGFTRSNIYRYFATREDIFMSLLIGESQIWLEDIKAGFTRPMDTDDFVRSWVKILEKNMLLVEMTPLLAPFLEQHCSPEIYIKMKKDMNSATHSIVQSIRRSLPDIDNDQAIELIRVNQALIAGLYPMTRRTKWQDETIVRLELPAMKFDFIDELTKALQIYVRGLYTNSF